MLSSITTQQSRHQNTTDAKVNYRSRTLTMLPAGGQPLGVSSHPDRVWPLTPGRVPMLQKVLSHTGADVSIYFRPFVPLHLKLLHSH